MIYHKIQLLYFNLKKLVIDVTHPKHPLYSSPAARKILQAYALIEEVLELIKK